MRTRTGIFGTGILLLVIGFYFTSIVDEPSQCSDFSDLEKMEECADLIKTRGDIITYANFLGTLFTLSAIFLAIGDLQSK
tara:strand:+ start:338 stop:577 length:240 start_codon:yes stop_codon:yes gene_type:complete